MFIKKNNKIYEQVENQIDIKNIKETLQILKKEKQNAIKKANKAFDNEIEKLEKDIEKVEALENK